MENKDKAIAGGAAVLASAAIAAVGISGGETTLKGRYEIHNINAYESQINVYVPNEIKPDICELKLNDLTVTKTLLPHGVFHVYPIVASDTEYLSLDLYVKGDLAGTAEFLPDGELSITFDKKYVEEGEHETN